MGSGVKLKRGGQKNAKCIVGSILTPKRKKLKTVEKLKLDKNKVKSKMVFRAYDSKKGGKMGQNAIWGSGV